MKYSTRHNLPKCLSTLVYRLLSDSRKREGTRDKIKYKRKQKNRNKKNQKKIDYREFECVSPE